MEKSDDSKLKTASASAFIPKLVLLTCNNLAISGAAKENCVDAIEQRSCQMAGTSDNAIESPLQMTEAVNNNAKEIEGDLLNAHVVDDNPAESSHVAIVSNPCISQNLVTSTYTTPLWDPELGLVKIQLMWLQNVKDDNHATVRIQKILSWSTCTRDSTPTEKWAWVRSSLKRLMVIGGLMEKMPFELRPQVATI